VLIIPRLIVEILSDSTEAYDRGAKFLAYQSIDTFQEYLLVAQDRPYVTHYVRQPDGGWLRSDIEGLERVINLASISCAIPLRVIYSSIEFPSAGAQ
jgi:Uma2 family endonuclease